jgi:hypothetical protein
MSIKLAILKSGENVISDIKEGLVDERVVTYILDKPYEVTLMRSEDPLDTKLQMSLVRWPILSADDIVPIITDWVVAVVEPQAQVKEMYIEEVMNGRTEENADGFDLNTEISVGLSD